jgi:putative transposase
MLFSIQLPVCHPDAPVSRFLRRAARSLSSFLAFVIDVVEDGLRFLRLAIRSHSAFYQERQVQPPHRLDDCARATLVFWSRLFDWKDALVVVKPETLIGWHRKGFKLFWKWKSRVGRPRLPEDMRKLIVRMASENPTWGQARVAAELSVKLGVHVSPRTVRAYWPRKPHRRGPRGTSSQHWTTFVRNHAQSMVAYFLVVVTARFRSLYVFLLMEIRTRRIDSIPEKTAS